MALPYASSSAGQAREKEIRDTLRSVGATAVGFMVDDDSDRIICQFRLRGREITVPLWIGAYERAWLAENPHNRRMRSTEAQHGKKARAQAERAAHGWTSAGRLAGRPGGADRARKERVGAHPERGGGNGRGTRADHVLRDGFR